MSPWSGTIPTAKEICSAQSHESGCTSLYLGSKEGESVVGLAAESDTNAPPPPLWYRARAYGRDALSGFFGTMILILFGDGVVAQVLLSHDEKGSYQSISWGWGVSFSPPPLFLHISNRILTPVTHRLGAMLGIYVSGASGSHINPAVTFAKCVFRGFSWRKFPIYALSQILGAICGAAIVYGNYKSAIDVYEGGYNIRSVPGYSTTATAGIFCNYPAEFMTKIGQFFSEFLASAILMFMIFALEDDNNLGASHLMPLAPFFVVFGIGACLGWETDYAINPARDFGPRLISYMLGYGHEVWEASNYYFWVPLIAPLLGCTFGASVYDLFLYTGLDSPMNTLWMGNIQLFGPLHRKQVTLQSPV